MRTLFLLLISLSFVNLSAQQPAEFRFTRLGMLQGLSSNSINTTLTDSRGFTWIGTINGLNRFDGENFRVYAHHRNDPASLPGDNIFSLVEDAGGDIWVGTDAGIAVLNPWNEQATSIPFVPFARSTGAPSRVYVGRDKTIWAWNREALWKYDAAKKTFLPELDSKTIPNSTGISTIYQDSHARFWLCTHNGLWRYDTRTKQLHECAPSTKLHLVMSLFEDHLGNLWIGTWGDGLGRYYPETDEVQLYAWIQHPVNPSIANIGSCFAETFYDNRYQLWAATNNGVALITGDFADEQHVTFLQTNAADPQTLPSNLANCIATNSEGQLWVGTAEGIAVLLPEHQLFRPFVTNYTGQTIRVVNDGANTFLCTWYAGLRLVDSAGTIVRYWEQIPASNEPTGTHVSDVLRTRNGELWVATFEGLCIGDSAGKNFRVVLPDGSANSICDRHITSLMQDKRGVIWCGSYGKGISAFDPATQQWRTYKETTPGSPITSDLVWESFCDRDGELWFGANDGIGRMNVQTGKVQTWEKITSGNDTFTTGIVSSIFQSSDGTTWFGTEAGMVSFMKKDGAFHVYTKDDGLPGNVYGISEDAEKYVWVNTSNGLARFDAATKTFNVYSIASGLPFANLEGDLGRISGGRLLLGLSSRAIVFDPTNLNMQNAGPRLFLTGIEVSGKDIRYASAPGAGTPLESPWDENVFTFDFVSPGFHSGPGLRYSYRLIGADQNWIYSGTRHAASYGGLPPGSYTFEYRVSTGNGQWSKPGAFAFTIHPPFWRTWWFIATVTIITLLIVIIVVRREATRKIRERLLVLEKQQAIEKERNRISRDMHDDLGSGLTKIAILSEVVKKKMDRPAEAQQQIDTISDSARNLVDNLNEIIWALNPDNDNFHNLAAYTREYADKYLEPFGIRLECEVPDALAAVQLSEEKRRFLFLVVKETLHNLVKHAQATVVKLRFETATATLRITIEDDGKGFEISESRPLGNGLKNMRRRMESIGASFTIESAPGKGTRTEIVVTL